MSYDDDSWRSDEPSQKQISRIKWWCKKLNITPPLFNTKGEASDFIGQLEADHPEFSDAWEKKKERLSASRKKREEKEEQYWTVFGLELRVDDWRTIYHCKKVSHSAFKKVIEAIGMPPENSNDTDFMAPFFAGLQRQRPDLFSHGKSIRTPFSTKGLSFRIAETSPPIITQPPPLRAAPPPLPEPAERVIRLNCSNCQQHIEVNADAEGQSFDCPNCGSKVDVGNFEDYQTPAVTNEAEPISYQTIKQQSELGTHDNLKRTLITIGSIAVVLLVGIVLFTVSTKAMHRDAAKASAEKEAEAEHQRKVDAVAKRIADAQAKRDAEAINKNDAPIADRIKKQLIDEVNSLSERFQMSPTNFLRMHYVGGKLGFSLND